MASQALPDQPGAAAEGTIAYVHFAVSSCIADHKCDDQIRCFVQTKPQQPMIYLLVMTAMALQ